MEKQRKLPSLNSITKNVCEYLNKTKDKEMISMH